MGRRPVIGVMTCARPKHEKTPEYLELAVGQKYMQPLLDREALPFPIPNFGEQTPFDAIMDQIDGLLLTGSLSNVHPDRYAGDISAKSYPLDPTGTPARGVCWIAVSRKASPCLPCVAAFRS